MIKSVYFPLKGSGYLYSHPAEPVKPERGYRDYNACTDEELLEAQKQWAEKHREWLKIKDTFKLPCAKFLIGRTFNFEPGKINIIFGPNGSGKSTIIKAIAGAACCNDGYTQLCEPFLFRHSLSLSNKSDEERYSEKEFLALIENKKQNSSKINWDGSPVYYHNFSKTIEDSGRSFGELMNSGIINSEEEEMLFLLGSKEVSSGQKASWIFNKLVNVISKDISLKNVLDQEMGKVKRANDVWKTAYKTQYDYFSKLANFSKNGEKTILLDEIDINLDFETIYRLYIEILPRLVKKYNTQIIAVSHSPIILSNEIINSPDYKVISIDDRYTDDVKGILQKLNF